MELFTEVISLIVMWVMGFVTGYIIFAPESDYKQSFMDGLTLKMIWGKFIKDHNKE